MSSVRLPPIRAPDRPGSEGAASPRQHPPSPVAEPVVPSSAASSGSGDSLTYVGVRSPSAAQASCRQHPPSPVAEPVVPSSAASNGSGDSLTYVGVRSPSAAQASCWQHPPPPVAERVVPSSAASNGSMDSLQSAVQASGRRRFGSFEFCDAEKIKQRVRESAGKQASCSDESRYYKSDGFFQAVARSPRFENLTLGIVHLQAIWIAIDTDWNDAVTLKDADAIFVVADSLFFTYFSLELLIRFCAFERKLDCMKDAWFMFDTFLVALYAFDPFVLTIIAMASGSGPRLSTSVLRLLRLARVKRLIRMLRSNLEFTIIVKAIFTAAACASYTFGLLIAIIYMFGIAMTLLSGEFGDEPPAAVIAEMCWITQVNETTGAEEDVRVEPGEEDCPLPAKAYLTGVGQSMYSLTVHGTFLDDLSVFADAIKAEPKGSTLCMIALTIFILVASMTIMNVLLGILLEVISAVAAEKRETIMVEMVYEKFEPIVKQVGADEGATLSWVKFEQIVGLPEAIRAFKQFKVDPELIIDFAQDWFIDEDGNMKELSTHHFIDMILDLRGGQDLHVKDIMQASKRFNRQFTELYAMIRSIDEKIVVARSKLSARGARRPGARRTRVCAQLDLT